MSADNHAEIAKHKDGKTAHNHAQIAKAIWKNCGFDCTAGLLTIFPIKEQHFVFNLLETDSNGQPTQAAKASALDVLCSDDLSHELYDMCVPIHQTSGKWLIEIHIDMKVYPVYGDNPPAAIYKAACEVLNLEVEPKCEHGRGMTDYCLECNRVNGGG